jgi:hypothetical protein
MDLTEESGGSAIISGREKLIIRSAYVRTVAQGVAVEEQTLK